MDPVACLKKAICVFYKRETTRPVVETAREKERIPFWSILLQLRTGPHLLGLARHVWRYFLLALARPIYLLGRIAIYI